MPEPDAFSFSNDDAHNRALVRCIDLLAAKGASNATVLKYVTDLTSGRNTYGAVSELLTYLWLLDHDIDLDIQVPMSGAEILNPNGSELDGRFSHLGTFFDIKGFGFQEALVERLRTNLQKDMPGTWIAMQGTWDVSIEMMQDLLSGVAYKQLLSDLQQHKTVRRGALEIIARAPQRVRVEHHHHEPYRLARENAGYAFRFAKQFCRKEPFILFFSHHPWLGGLSLNTDFADIASTFTRAFARRTFIQFLHDASPLFDITKGEASKLISAIGFLNISQIPRVQGSRPSASLTFYVNPNATNPLSGLTIDHLRLRDPYAVLIESLADDNY